MPHPPVPARFRVLAELPAPDAAALYRARDTLLGRDVLLKQPPRVFGSDAASERSKSMREARALARASHPGIVRLLDVVESDQGPWLVIDPPKGATLAEMLARERTLDAARVRAIGQELCSALEVVHALGIVHRGIACSNVHLEPDGTVLLAGFTFAKGSPGLGADAPGTTFRYARDFAPASGSTPIPEPPHPAPEQIGGAEADARSDVFGLGWVLFECLTGLAPYAVECDVATWRLAPARGVDRRLAAVVARCLELDPVRRYASVAAVRAALELSAQAGGSRRRAWIAAAGVAIAGAAVALLARWDGARTEASPEGARGRPVAAPEPAGALAPSYAASRALLIGVGDAYAASGWPVLPNAEDDVRALAARLEELRAVEPWTVKTLVGAEATRAAILAEVRALERDAGADDKLFVYYAGHGEAAEISPDLSWLIPAGAPTADADPGRTQWVTFDELHHLLDNTRAKHVLVAMDCCYGGRMTRLRSGSPKGFEAKFLTGRARVVITSGRPDDRVADGASGGRSPFAAAFLERLAGEERAITTSQIYAHVSTRLAGRWPQQPSLAYPDPSNAGEVVFFLR